MDNWFGIAVGVYLGLVVFMMLFVAPTSLSGTQYQDIRNACKGRQGVAQVIMEPGPIAEVDGAVCRNGEVRDVK